MTRTAVPVHRREAAEAPTEASPPPSLRRIVVVSNRLPFTVERHGSGVRVRRSSGGLVSALDPALRARGGTWIGWTGAAPGDVALPPSGGVRYRAVPLTPREAALYYGGFSNGTLWPLFHYFVGRTRIDAATWRAYDRINERFAAAAAEESDDAAIVWVHDYHLLRVPGYLRQRAPGRRIAFFLHIPFPAFDVFRVLPWSRSLIRGMLAADLVGFQVSGYAEHFLDCAERLLGCDVTHRPGGGLVQYEGRQIAVEAHPIGIDVERNAQLAARAPAVAGAGAVAQVIGLDRLDYTKGIHERLLGLERFLERRPEFRGRVVFTQVVVPSRERVDEYRALKRELDETVGRINGRFSDGRWTPIRYQVRHLGAEELAALYRQADAALVTPLRDGMNLVAKEYVTAQVDERGVLILSEMAGAAEELQEALLVNPFDPDALADALHRALVMPADERRARMAALRDRVRARPVQTWVDAFLAAAEAARDHGSVAPSPAAALCRRLLPWLAGRPTVALFLDYDGTLTPIARRPADAVLADAAREALRRAARTPNLDVTVVSGRALADLQALVDVPGLTYVGNHGFEIEGPGLSYRPPGFAGRDSAIDAAAADLAALDVPGLRVEAKGPTLSVHLREVADADREEAEGRAVELLKRRRLRITHGKMVVEGRPPVEWDKGRAVQYVLVARHGAQWPTRVRALYAGDDLTDEDAFRSLRGIGRSIRVGVLPPATPSSADYALPDPDAVIEVLRWLAAGAFQGGHA